MIFEGDRDFPLPLPQTWEKLRDARWLVQCIPDSSPGEGASLDRATCTVRPGVSFVRGSLGVVLEVANATEQRSVRFFVISKGIGSSAEVETVLTFSVQDSGTRVHWRAEISQLGGLLKAVPGGLIRGAAQKVIQDVWAGISARIQNP